VTKLRAAFRSCFVEEPKSQTSKISGILFHFKDVLSGFSLVRHRNIAWTSLSSKPPFRFRLTVCHYLPAMCSYLLNIPTS
jgi:hypothetical protein